MQEKICKALKALEKAKIFILLLCQPSHLIPNINAHIMFQKSSTTTKAKLQNVICYSPARVEKACGYPHHMPHLRVVFPARGRDVPANINRR